jgi:glycosyltransferase involved in cell wall biosynthesis
MKIAYLMNGFDPGNVNKYPFGVGWFITKSLEQEGCEIKFIDAGVEPSPLFFKGKQFFYKYLLKKIHWRQREPFILKKLAIQSESKLKQIDYDIILSFGSLPIAFIKSDKPIVFWTDATFAGLLNFYEDYSNLSNEIIKKANEIEQVALNNCKFAIFTSEWAKQSAIDNYKVNPEKLIVIPFGANIKTNLDKNEIDLIVENRCRNICKLLLFGNNWKRKGGDKAVQLASVLNKNGLKTELHIIGVQPDIENPYPVFIKYHGYLNKTNNNDFIRLNKIISESHFLIHLAKADCTPHALNEANAYGVPCIASNVGGIPSIITNGKNGRLFSLDAPIDNITEYISRLMTNYEDYLKLAISSFKEYEERLNWAVSAKKVKELLEGLIK